MKTSTNALTARYCATQGLLCETVQTWRGNKRHDAFGFADSLVLGSFEVILVQNCSYGTLKAHRDAIDAHDSLERILLSGVKVECWEWRRPKLKRGSKNKSRMWQMRSQSYSRASGWSKISEWCEPVDLYPKKPK